MRRRAALAAPLVLVAAALTVSERSQATGRAAALRGTVGPGFTITLKTAQGKLVRKLQPGTYTIQIRDLSPIHNFHLFGPGVNKLTSVQGMGNSRRRAKRMRWNRGRTGVGAIVVLGAMYGAAVAFGAPPMMNAHTGAHLEVLSPQSGFTLTGNTLDTDVSITHFKVDCRFAGTANRMGIGHYHIEIDHSLINMFCGPRGQVSMQNVAPGKHTVQFIPAADDHADDMKAMKQISFTYKPSHLLPALKPINVPGKPQVSIVSPKPGATVHGGFDFVVAVKNFRLSCALYGKADVKGYGHWRANVDTNTMGMMGMGTMLGMSCAKVVPRLARRDQAR